MSIIHVEGFVVNNLTTIMIDRQHSRIFTLPEVCSPFIAQNPYTPIPSVIRMLMEKKKTCSKYNTQLKQESAKFLRKRLCEFIDEAIALFLLTVPFIIFLSL